MRPRKISRHRPRTCHQGTNSSRRPGHDHEMYQTWFARNWYKLDRLVDSTGTKLALGDILTDETMFEAQGWLRGSRQHPALALTSRPTTAVRRTRHRHRGRRSFGGLQQHHLTYGVRAHEDFMDRYQWRDRYAMVDGQMALTAGDSGSAGNRIEAARALAGHASSVSRGQLDVHARRAANAWRCRGRI